MAAGSAPTTATAQIRVVVSLAAAPLPTVTVTASDPFAARSRMNWGAFRLTRTGDQNTTLSIYFTLAGTAVSGQDYDPLAVPVSIPSGAAYVPVIVKPNPASLHKIQASVRLTLSPGTAYLVGSPAAATVTIVDSTAIDRRLWSLYE